MTRNLIKYPDPTIRLISANVRLFDDELKGWITDMIDTIKEHNLVALSAILIGIQYNILVVKEDETFKAYINGRLIKHSGKSSKTERSIYYDGISVDVERYENVTIIYENECGEQKSKDLCGDEARLFQHYLDYAFGSTFVDRVDKEMKERISKHLEFGLVKEGVTGESCPTVFYRDYIKKSAKYILGLVILTFLTPFFTTTETVSKIQLFDKFLLLLVPIIIITYFFYAQYESKKYKQCTSCQTGNILGVSFILGLQLLIVSAVFFWWLAR
jgi:peptide deformylase